MICFAVKEEAAPFERVMGGDPSVRMLVTGMGRRNAQRAIRKALEEGRPDLVLTCGFAGGLRMGLASGTVLFEAPAGAELTKALIAAGARPGRFHCAPKVATTAQEKRKLAEATSADAVEMESQVIRAACDERAIPCITVRVILDPVEEDLPLDFNALLTPEEKIHPGKLALAVAASPGKIGGLLRLQKQSRAAAEAMARVLGAVVRA